MMVSNEEIDKIIERIYEVYGSSTGWLFGIPSDLKEAVRVIVKVPLTIINIGFWILCEVNTNG